MKKRKHHNAWKRADRLFKDVRIWTWESSRVNGIQEAAGEARIGYVWKDLTTRQAAGILAQTNNWIIVCRALVWFGDESEDCLESELIGMKSIKIDQLEEEYQKLRAGVLASVQRRHVYDVGWIVQSFSDISKIDEEKWQLIGKGSATEERRQKWLAADALIQEEQRLKIAMVA